MRIPSIESDLSQLKSAGLDPKALALIEKLAAQPLLIQKLDINSRGGLTLSPGNSPLLSQLQLPIKTGSGLSFLTQTSANLTLTIKNNLVSLQVAPQASGLANSSNQVVTEFLFKQAKLIQNSVLRLSQLTQIPQQNAQLSADSRPQSTRTTTAPQPTGAAQSSLTRANGQPDQSANQAEIRQAISQLLKSRPTVQPALANSLTTFFEHNKSLVKSFNSQMGNLGPGNLVPGNTGPGNNQPLTGAALTELIAKLQTYSPDAPVTKALKSLFTSIEQLRSLLDFSSNNRQLSVERRLQSSGSFFESKLKNDSFLNQQLSASTHVKPANSGEKNLTATTSASQSKNQPAQTSNESISGKFRTANDIKQLGMQIRQAATAILEQLNQPGATSLNNLRLLNQLVQQPGFQQALLPPAQEAERAAVIPAPTSSDGDELANPANQIFQNKMLQKLPWQSLINNQGRSLNLPKEMDFSLLNTQRQLLSDMLSEINATLNKIETNQLLSLRNESHLLPQYLIELPIYRAGAVDSFEILFEGNQSENERTANKIWTVTIRFDLEPLGPMFARVKLKGERVSTHFFAEDESTAHLLNEHLPHLEKSLFSAGIDIDEIKGLQGIVPESLTINDEQTIDIRV